MINAFESPHLYRFMSVEQEASDDLLVSLATFERLVQVVQDTISAGRLDHRDVPHRRHRRVVLPPSRTAHDVMSVNNNVTVPVGN